MQKYKKLLSLILTIVMVAGLFVNCFAEPVGPNPTKLRVATPNEQSVPVNLTAAADTFNVTIPTILPITVNEKGTTFAASNAKITNNGKGPVSIKSIDITPTSGWFIVPTNTDFSKLAVDTKQIGLNMFGIEVPVNGVFPIDFLKQIDSGDNLALPYDSKIATQKTVITNTSVNVLFTIGWETVFLPPPTVGTSYDDGTYVYSYGGGFRVNGVADPITGQNGWGVQIKDIYSTAPVTKAPLTSIQGYPVTNMRGMFYQSQATSIDLSGFDTSNVTDMKNMFQYSKTTTITFPAEFGNNATNMSGMFHGSAAATLNLPEGFGSNATEMNYMFYDSAATTIDFPNGFGSNATDMSLMFTDSAATTLNLPEGFGSNATNMNSMFQNSAATTITFPKGFGSNTTDMMAMFNSSVATTLTFLDGFGSNATDMVSMFSKSRATTITLPNGFGSKATNMRDMFNSSAATTLTFLDGFGSNATDMRDMFNASSATTLDFPAGFGSNATDMYQMFVYSAAATLNLPEGFGSNATDMSYMFLNFLATTGYTETQAEADKWNNSTATTKKPAALTFTVKP